MDLNPEIVQVNGPVNVVRMEGYIENIKKIIYIFMDFHINVDNQLACDNVFRQDIENYFAKSFSKLNGSDIIYDFFMETWTMNLENISFGLPIKTKYNFKDMYILEVLKLFRKLFKFNPDINKVSISEYFTNLRLHYLDIRTFFERDYYFILKDFSLGISIRGIDNVEYLHYIIDFLNNFIHYCDALNKIIIDIENNKYPVKKVNIINFFKSNNLKRTSDELEKENYDELIYLIHKMFYSYKHDNIKIIMQKQFDNIKINLKTLINDSNSIIEFISNILNVSKNVYDGNIINLNGKINYGKLTKNNRTGSYNYGLAYEQIEKIKFGLSLDLNYLADNLRNFFIMFMDIFFIRRFLDKDYITNGISYTGAAHSVVYIDILSKLFDFKITHFSYSKITDLDKLNSEIIGLSGNDLQEIFFPEKITQCSDITNFPKNFK